MPEEVNIDQVKHLVKLVEKHNLAELTVEQDGITITIKGIDGTAVPATIVAAEHHIEHATVYSEDHEQAEAEEEAPENVIRVGSPMIGVFYRASSPDVPPLIEVGDTVEVGQTIGLIEAMKVFSEVPSEVAGLIIEIPVENGKLVQQGETLMVVRPE